VSVLPVSQGSRTGRGGRLRGLRKGSAAKWLRFVSIRLALGLLTLLAVSIVVFAATQALPGDAARAILGQTASPARLAAVRAQLHLDTSVVSQYLHWLSDLLHGNLGTSIVQQEPVSTVIGQRVLNSAFLVVVASLITFPGAIVLGSIAAYRRDTVFDHINSGITLALSALPDFVIALSLVLLLSTSVMHLLPAVSLIPPGGKPWTQPNLLVLPVLTLVIWELPYVSRIMRASMIEVLESEYVESARLKGIPERRLLWRHALPNAVIPTIQVTAVQIAFLAGSLVVVEYVFDYQGIGQGFVQAVTDRDVPVVQGIAILIAAVYVVVNLLADVATVLLSPRLRTSLK
jgi:peptide/nickel transport system permease protein